MRTARRIFIEAVVALGAAGTIASAVAVPAVTAAAPAAVTASGSYTFYHG